MVSSQSTRQWQPLKKDVIDALADEILHNYARGRIAVDGGIASGVTAFAEDLAVSLRDKGRSVTVAEANGDFDTDLLLVAGERLQVPELAGKWNFRVWVDGAESPELADTALAEYIREISPRAKANAIVDNRDPEHPRRRFADSC
jgi:uridine kinase